MDLTTTSTSAPFVGTRSTVAEIPLAITKATPLPGYVATPIPGYLAMSVDDAALEVHDNNPDVSELTRNFWRRLWRKKAYYAAASNLKPVGELPGAIEYRGEIFHLWKALVDQNDEFSGVFGWRFKSESGRTFDILKDHVLKD